MSDKRGQGERAREEDRARERAREEDRARERTERGQSEGVDVEGDACEEWKDRRR